MISNFPNSKKFLKLFTQEILLNSYKQFDKKEESSLDKLKQLIRDKEVQGIECGGPGKFLLIKKNNQVDVSNITLRENEIKQFIIYFAKKAEVPFEGGILNAAIGSLKINALESEFAGSRFILTRIPRMT